MKQLSNMSFCEIEESELENIFGGNARRIFYIENGVLKWKEVAN